MSLIGWVIAALVGVSAVTEFIIYIRWRKEDKRLIKELNQKKWWEEIPPERSKK